MKSEQRQLYEESNKFSFLPPSPPQIISEQDSHYQSSSSPIGKPPPYMDEINENDAILLEDLKSLLESTSSDLVHEQEEPFLIQQQGMDIDLFDDQFDEMTFDDSFVLFPDLPETP